MSHARRLVRKGVRLAGIYVAISAITAFLVFPFVWMLSTSLKAGDEIFTALPRWIPRRPTLANYRAIWTQTLFPRFFMNSVIVASATMACTIAVTVFSAYAISRFRFKGRRLVSMWLLFTQMFPPVLLVIPMFVIMYSLKLVNRYPALVITYGTFAIPFATWMLKGYFDTIPRTLEEAAMVDGCTMEQSLFKIVLPLAAPGIAAVALFTFLLAWQEYMFGLTLTRSDTMRTLPVGIGLFLGFRQVMWGHIMAGSVIATLPVVVFFMYLQRYLVQGMTLGAVKE